MSLKLSLKACKAAIARDDPEDALHYAKEAIKTDKNCYFAHVFEGKAYHLLSNFARASKSFEKATAIEPENLLGWRGWYQVSKSGDSFEQYFNVLTKYLQVQLEQETPISETIKDVLNYMHKQNYQQNVELLEIYFRAVVPGTELSTLVGSSLGNPSDNVQKLLTLVKTREDTEVRKALAKEKLRQPRIPTAQSMEKLHEVEWQIRQKSDISMLYEKLLEICEDDAIRRETEVSFLRYKHNLLKIVADKTALLREVKEMADDLVLLGTPDLFTWSLHLDLQDTKTLGELDQTLLANCIKKFKGEGLSAVLYSYAMSDMCPFEKEKFKDIYLDKNEENDEDESLELIENDAFATDEVHADGLSASEVLDLMLQGYAKCSDSMLAHRIVCDYYIHLQEYEAASRLCTAVIGNLADLQRTYGIDLVHCKEDILCSLAAVYTYHEAPKDYPRALQLYNKILGDSPDNKQALIGKGLILVAKRELESAQILLSQVALDFPTDSRALMELGWCHVLQKHYENGRAILAAALENVHGVSSKSFITRADIRWRIAKSYVFEDSNNETYLKLAYGMLVLALKDTKTFAPAYTLLGVLYYDHFDDKPRAQKCFYKAFELDVAEITAAKCLVQDLAAKSDWDVTEILCKRVVTHERSRRILFSHLYEDTDKSWPYRVLGCSALNRQDDAKAIEWFQTALRMQAMDTQCWIGLGEAYYNCGRMDAAMKVFQHTTQADPDSWVSQYMLGISVCAIGDYVDGLEVLQKALKMNPAECVLNALYENHILHSAQLLAGGFIKRTLASNSSAIKVIAQASDVNHSSLSLWRSLGECLKLVIKVQQDVDQSPIGTIVDILNKVELLDDELASLDEAKSLFQNGSHSQAIAMLGILTARAAIKTLPSKTHKFIRSYTSYNYGLALLEAFAICDETRESYRTCAIEQFKQAIKLESENAQYWIALGNAYVPSDPQLAQHCFIKASVFDSRDVSVWSNLAALYLRHGDAELAQGAFDRATSQAPEQSTPWLGNALSAEAMGNEEKAKRLSTHAYVLSNGRSPLAQLCYGLSVVNSRIKHSEDARDVEAAQEFSIANFAIQTFLKFQPNNETGLKLAILLSERCQTYETSIAIGEKLCAMLEARFEKSESSSVLLDVATTKTTLARVYLGMGNYESAIENAQFTLDLVSEEENSDLVSEAALSSRIVIGLSFFFNEQYSEALEEFQMILAQHSMSQKAVALTAQVLYALDTPESKQAAIDQLFSFIEQNGSSLLVVLTLGAISLANDFDDYYEPIKEELEGLDLQELIGDNFRQVPKLLKEISDRVSGKDDSAVWQKFALFFPGDFNIWKNLDTHMALSSALLTDSKRTAMEVSRAYAENSTRRELQRALLICADNHEARSVFVGV